MLVVQIILIIITIMVLIKQFKHGGALHGIIGLITCGFWTFIWGWMKHKGLELTKVMILWTILIVTPMALVGVFGVAMLTELLNIATSLTEEGGLDKIMKGFDKKEVKKISGRKSKQPKKAAKLPKKTTDKNAKQGDRDWRKEAVALWKDGKYSDPNKALDYWNKAIRMNPKSAEAYNNRGLAFYNLKRYQQALKDYSQAIRMKPADSIAYNNRGNTYYEMFKYEPAEADFNKSIDLNPQYANAYLNRGLVYYQLDKKEQACTDFEKACELKECQGLDWAKQKGLCN
jgi:tetratricopeptide (TPR) repeat protein